MTWEGEERRQPEGLLLSIMNHVSSRIEEVEKRHEERYNHLDNKITTLTNSINSWMEKEPAAILDQAEVMMDELVPTHPDNPDATRHEKRKEHRVAHSKWIANVNDEMARWKRIREEVTKWAIIGAAGIIITGTWQYLLKG